MKILYAYPYMGELGWEIGNWLPYVTWHARNAGATQLILGTRTGREGLYSGVVSLFNRHRIDCRSDYASVTECNLFLRECPAAYAWYAKIVDEADAEVSCLRAAGAEVVQLNLPSVSGRMYVTPETRRAVPEFSQFNCDFDIAKNCVVLHVRALSRSPKKNTAQYLIDAVCRFCSVRHLPLVVVGQAHDMPVSIKYGLSLLNQTSLADLIAVFQKAALVVGSSSGPMHLAAAVGVPHIVWGGERSDVTRRYLTTWNMKRTPCHHLGVSWSIGSNVLLDALDSWLASGCVVKPVVN